MFAYMMQVRQEMPEWQPMAILVDASDAEISAIQHAFKGDAAVFLCHWHVQRSWKKQLYNKVWVLGMPV